MWQTISGFNWLGLVLGALVAYGFGAIWYHPKVMGTAWMRAQGKTAQDFAGSAPGPAMLVHAFYVLLMALLIAFLQVQGAFLLGLVLLLLSVLLGMLSGTLFQGASPRLWTITAGNEAISIGIIAACIHWI